MSIEGNTGLTSHQMLRQSLDRFDDKLAENILSYLTFNEKVMFESVSKQWKRLIYNQQKHLSLSRGPTESHNSLNSILIPLVAEDFIGGYAINNNLKAVHKNRLKSVLKKCKSIETVVLDCFLDLEVLDIVGGHCPRLKSLRFDCTGLCADDLDQFGRRYGHLINCLQIYSVWPYVPRYYTPKFLIHCKNLKEYRSARSCELLREGADYLPQLESVDDFYLGHLSDEECDEPKECKITSKFELFCNKYHDQMKKAKIIAFNAFDQAQLRSFFTSICKFNNLTQLELDFDTSDQIDYSINEYLVLISKHNPNLKSFKLSLYTEWIQMEQLFCAFEGFQNLIHLKIAIIYYNDMKPIKGSVECFKTLEKLKSFDINYKSVGEEFFEAIDKHLPNLSELTIECESELTDKTIFQLSNLKKLKEFYFYKYNQNNQKITDDSICAVLNGCPSLEKMCFRSRPNITNKTIETLIRCANSRPKRRLIFEIQSSDPNLMEENQIQAIDLNSFAQTIPQNLTIIISDVPF